MYVQSGTWDFVPPVRDRLSRIGFIVSCKMSVLTEKERNEMSDTVWARYVQKAIWEEFPGMYQMTKNARYMSVLVEWVKKDVSLTYEWIGVECARKNLSYRLSILRERRAFDQNVWSGWINRLERIAWKRAYCAVGTKYAVGTDYWSCVRFVEKIVNEGVRYARSQMR